MSRTSDQYLDSMEYINNIVGIAIHEGYLDTNKALEMTDKQKRDWYDALTTQTMEVELI